jgi:ADP-heptose:LPS heptosyltransferase
MAYLADIPLRLAHCRENPYQHLTHWVAETDPGEDGRMRHEVRRHLDLVAAIGSTTERELLSLQVPENAYRRVRRILAGQGLDLSCPWVVIHAGATAASRRYRPEGFAQVGRELAAIHGMQVVFTGDLHEVPLVEEVRNLMAHPSITLAGRLSLADFSALIALAPLLISNNTGPVHIAAAVGTPVVDIYALTNPQHTPWGIPHRLLYHDVPCKYCYKSVCPMGHHDCLRLVSPEMVVQAALELAGEKEISSEASAETEVSSSSEISLQGPAGRVGS